MKNKSLTLMLSVIGLLNSSFQAPPLPCQKVNIVRTEAEKKVMREVIDEWKRDRYFIADNQLNYKGVVRLTVGKNSKGNQLWGVTPMIADGYRYNPPAKYDEYEGTVILIYEEDEKGRLLPVEGDKDERNRCLQEVIGDRLYINPSPTPHLHRKMIEITLPDGRKRMEEVKKDVLGNGGADYWINFNKDGTYTKTPMA